MASTAKKKSTALSMLVQMVPKAQALSRDIAEIQKYFVDNGFLIGGTDLVVDSDCAGDGIDHLTAATVNSGITALASMTLSTNNATTLRKLAATPALPQV